MEIVSRNARRNRDCSRHYPGFVLLELAKGFEPLTL